MSRELLVRVSLPASATLREVLDCIDGSGMHVALLCADDGRLAGLLTDGDARRALLADAPLTGPALPHATTAPQTVAEGSSRAHVLDLMRALHISAVPEVDVRGQVVGLHTLSGAIGVEPLPNAAVVMAGGRGTRLGALTRTTPKPLLEVAGRSIIEWIVLNLVGGGVHDIHVSVNHLAERVEEHLGDGSRLGCRISYLREDPEHPLGTAGSLALLRERYPRLDSPTLVMNGDLLVQFEPQRLLSHHRATGASVTVATRGYQHEVPFGVVDSRADGVVTDIREKPQLSLTVNAGVYAVASDALDLVPRGVASTMPGLIQACLREGRTVASWPLPSDWIDIGTPTDLARAKEGR